MDCLFPRYAVAPGPLPGRTQIESFLTDLAVHGHIAPATQDQPMNAIVVLYKRVLNYPMEGRINDMRTYEHTNVPVVMTHEEVASVLSLMHGSQPNYFARHLRNGR